VDYSKLKAGIRLMFWSGASFDEENLKINTGKFKDAAITYTSSEQVIVSDMERWLQKSKEIQWDYKNIVKRKGRLERLK
jgi:pyruvate kinase